MSSAYNPESPPWLLPNFLARSSVNFLLGPLASKKTWLALDLAISIAAGHHWLGLAAQQTGAVYIDYALDPGLKERIHALLIAHKWPENLPINFGQESSLHGPQNIDSLLADVLPLKAGFIVLDSLLGMRLELNSRQAPSLAPYLNSLDHLSKEANAAVLVLHDLRSHRTDLGRALVAMGADHILAAESDYGKPPVHLRTLASADGTQVAINAQVQRSRRSAHISLSSSIPPSQLGTLGKRLLRHLQDYGQATTAQVLSSFPYSTPKRISNLIQELLTDAYIYRCNSGGRGRPAIYQITPAGYQAIFKAPLSGSAGEGPGVRGFTPRQVKGGFATRRGFSDATAACEEELCSDEAIPRQVSTSCQVSTIPAPASEGTSSHLSGNLARACPERSEWVGLEKDVAGKPTLRKVAHSQVYNHRFHNPFVSQRKPCSE